MQCCSSLAVLAALVLLVVTACLRCCGRRNRSRNRNQQQQAQVLWCNMQLQLT